MARRARGDRDGGFILLESVIAIAVITIVMGAVGAEFVGGLTSVSQQRAQQTAVQLASSTVEQIRALDASDLITGRGATSVNAQFVGAAAAVQPWLDNMDQATDSQASAGSGSTAAVPTVGVTSSAGSGGVSYTTNQYLGWCSIRATGSTDCVKTSTLGGAAATQYLRAVVAVTWTGQRCGTTGTPPTPKVCSYVTSTLVSATADRTFRVNAGAYPAPVVVAKPDQTVVVGDSVSLQMAVDNGTGVPPFTWAVSGGSLPVGLTLNSSTGQVTGTVGDSVGTFTSTMQVTDAFLRTDSEPVTWKVLAPLTVTNPGPQTSVVSTPVSPDPQLTASGGTGTYSWSDAAPRTLPAGLTLTSAGRISGTPTAVGSSTVTVTVTSGGSSKTVTFTWDVVKLNGASYNFEEGAGTTAADGTGHGHTATLQPGAGWTTGKIGSKALSLTGASTSFASTSEPDVDTSQSFSVAAWVKMTTVSDYKFFVGMDGSSVSPFYLQTSAGGAFAFTSFATDSTQTTVKSVNGITPLANTWYHLVGVYNKSAGTIELFVNGVSQGKLTGASAFRATGATTIGQALYGGSRTGYANGAMDDVFFYDRAITQSEVTALANPDLTGPTGGSVTPTGLTGTGSRYRTSTTVNLTLSKGSDPSGVATSGNQLQRATATLTNGTCGTYGSYAVVTGGTDPGTTFSETVGDNACYAYRYVVSDSVGNSTTYASGDVKVDTTAPVAPGLSFSDFTNASATGGTVYYRPGAGSGGFTVTASSTDPVSGIASYAFPGLGTGWTSTAGAPGVNAYTWAGVSPAAPGSRVVTTTNNAGTSSAGTSFTVTADSTAPGAGTLTYPDRTGPSTSVNISFTTGTDSGSGVGTRLLQRDSAPLSGTTCGTYTGFATVAGGTNPTSPFVDTVPTGSCYRYRYIVSDQVGNSTTTTSANVVKVKTTYADTVLATAGLLNWFRLGDVTSSSDSFTDASQTTLSSHTGEVGATWSFAGGANLAKVSSANRLYRSGSGYSAYYTSATPASADYSVEADLVFRSNIANDYAGVIGRLNTGNGNFYGARWQQGASSGSWVIYEYTGTTLTTLASTPAASRTTNQTNRIELEMIGSSLKLYVDGVLTASATDSTNAAAGRAGILDGNPSVAITKSETTGIQYDNFSVGTVPRVTDSKGSNLGDYLSGVVLGVAGAIAGDTDTAVTFDGVNDYASVTRTIQDDFAIEFWFKSTGGIGTGTQWWQGAGLVDAEVNGPANDFGVSLRSDGRVVAGDGSPDVSIVSSTGGYNNGAWHHVVFNRVKSSGAMQLYVDGASAGTATGSTASLNSPASINFGRSANGSNYLDGSLDEVALYNAVLSPATVTSHYDARQ